MKSSDTPSVPVIIGRGRVGGSLAGALQRRGLETELRERGHGLGSLGGRIVLLCVPDAEIGPLAARIGSEGEAPRLLGHTSGATGLEPLSASSAEGLFSIHPLQTVPDGETDLDRCHAAVSGTNDAALALAESLAEAAGMIPFEVPEEQRAAYHASASIASNFLVTLEQTAAELLEATGVSDPRAALSPLIRRSLENWLERGADALTGPIARGDEETVAAHRDAIAKLRPDLTGFYDELAERTREIATAGSAR